MKQRWMILALPILIGLGLVGCSGGDGEAKFDKVGSSISGGGESRRGVADSAADGASPTESQARDRDVIYTSDLVVRVKAVSRAAEQGRRIAEQAGGYIASQTADLEGDHEIRTTLRVPVKGFDDAMADLSALGKVLERNIDSQDVTDQVVDLQGRLKNAEVSSERLRQLLAKAENVVNILAIEGELTKRETEIEQLTGQLKVLNNQVDLATITVRFTEKGEPTVAKDVPGFVGSVKRGGVAVVNVLLVVAAVIGFILPFLPFVALGWLGVRVWRKRRPKKTATVPGWSGPTPGPSATSGAPWNPPKPPPPAASAPPRPESGDNESPSDAAS
ncbi:MAG: DUF4349 domain-containing protein [Aquihabitans sp.]